MHEVPDLIACEECDALHRKARLRADQIARCKRCGAELYRNSSGEIDRILPLAIGSLVVFVIANTFPIIEMEMQGIRNQTTLWGAVRNLGTQGMSAVSGVVLITTILFPLLQLSTLIYLLLTAHDQPRRRVFNPLLRLLQMLRPWGMIEVFMLGVLVALVKLSNTATVVPGVALWAFGALTVLLALIVAFNPRDLWWISPDSKAK